MVNDAATLRSEFKTIVDARPELSTDERILGDLRECTPFIEGQLFGRQREERLQLQQKWYENWLEKVHTKIAKELFPDEYKEMSKK